MVGLTRRIETFINVLTAGRGRREAKVAFAKRSVVQSHAKCMTTAVDITAGRVILGLSIQRRFIGVFFVARGRVVRPILVHGGLAVD